MTMHKQPIADRDQEIVAIVELPGGSDACYSHWLGRMVYTRGIKAMADTCEAYWLIDVIALAQLQASLDRDPDLSEFQVWVLERKPDSHAATLTCSRDSDVPPSWMMPITFTDFPLQSFKLYVCQGTLLLPSEY